MSHMPSRRRLANAIRALSMDAVQKANSGHPGMPMGMADIAEVLWNDFLKHNPQNPQWPNRDRFILSNGHGSLLQYALLHLSGYDLSIEDIQQFRQLHSKTPGHPEFGLAPGIETTTGPLGQGFANAVGMALAAELFAHTFNREGFPIVDHFTYCFMGDGCLMEGISHEVGSLAGTLGLGKLIVFWDDNGISIDGKIKNWFLDDTPKRFEAYGWHVIANIDGHDPNKIKNAILEAQANTQQPSLLCCKTIIGYGAPNMGGSERCHGQALGDEEILAARQFLDWQHGPFSIPQDIYKAYDKKEQGSILEEKWHTLFSAYRQKHPALAEEFERRIQGILPKTWKGDWNTFIQETALQKTKMATRKASQNTLNFIVPKLPELLGGSADLTESNLTFTSHSKAIFPHHIEGNYIYYGVREFGMSAMMNGIALYRGFIPYGGTFLTFLDYGRNAVRMSALMKQRVIFVYTHDSIGLGEDGPTHQPVEHLAMLRATPNMSVWRPCDATETAVAWQMAIERTTGPTSLAFTRQAVLPLERTAEQINNIYKGAYIVWQTQRIHFDLILIATGSEVELAILAAKRLTEEEGMGVRVISMPSVDVFKLQDYSYQQTILPKTVRARVAVEAAATLDWYQWVGLDGEVVGVDRFGESAPSAKVFEDLNITVDAIIDASHSVLSKNLDKEY